MADNDKILENETEKIDETKVTVENTDKKDDDEYEKVCFICRRPESVAGKMINLPNNICVCNDCMQKSFDIMNSGQIDYSQLMNIPGMQFINLADVEQTVPKQQKIKKKRESLWWILTIFRRPTRSKRSLMSMSWGRSMRRRLCRWRSTTTISGWLRILWTRLRLRSLIC